MPNMCIFHIYIQIEYLCTSSALAIVIHRIPLWVGVRAAIQQRSTIEIGWNEKQRDGWQIPPAKKKHTVRRWYTKAFSASFIVYQWMFVHLVSLWLNPLVGRFSSNSATRTDSLTHLALSFGSRCCNFDVQSTTNEFMFVCLCRVCCWIKLSLHMHGSVCVFVSALIFVECKQKKMLFFSVWLMYVSSFTYASHRIATYFILIVPSNWILNAHRDTGLSLSCQ